MDEKDSDTSHNGHGRDEKAVGMGNDGDQQLAGLPDPDAGLSEEERAKIVSDGDGCVNTIY